MRLKIKILFFVLVISAFYRGAVEYFPALESGASGVLLITDLAITYLGVSSIFSASKRTIAAFFLLLAFSTFAFFADADAVFSEHLNGLREVSSVFCLFLFFSTLIKTNYFNYFVRLFKVFALLFLAVQIPLATSQFLAFSAGDNVGGSFGAGGSGILTLTIFLLVFFLLELKRNRRQNFNRAKYLILFSGFFFPIFINETKLSLILIPLMMATFASFKQFKSTLLVFGVGAMILFSFVSFYSDEKLTSDNPFADILSRDFLETYLAEDNEELNIDLPRITKINRSIALLAEDYSTLIFGRDYSAFKGGTTVGLSSFSSKHQWLLQGTRPYLFYLLIVGGLSLTFLIGFLIFGEAFYKPTRDFKNYSLRLLIFLSLVFVIILFYDDAFRNQTFLMMFVSIFFFSKYYQSSKIFK